MPKVPRGSGEHPIALVVVSAKDLAAASKFYSKLFGWQVHPMSAELAGAGAPARPPPALRSNLPPGSPRLVPHITPPHVGAMPAPGAAAGGPAEPGAPGGPPAG